MNEKNKTMIILVIILGMLIAFPIMLFVNNSNRDKVVNDLLDAYENKESSLIYLGSSNCGYCDLFNPVIEGASENYEFEYEYVDTAKLTDTQFYDLLEKFDIKSEDFGTPYLVVGEKGSKTAERAGYYDENVLINFLKENKFLDEDVKPKKETVSVLTTINYDDYTELIKSDDKKIIVIAQVGCSACIQAKPVLNKIAEEQEIEINYFEIDLIDNEEDYNAFMESTKVLGLNEVRTPHIAIVQNNKEIDNILGSTTEENYIDLFKKHNFIK